MERIRKKHAMSAIKKDAWIFGILCVVFYAVGSYVGSDIIDHSDTINNSSFFADFDYLFFKWLSVFMPIIIAFLSGYSYLGNVYSSLAVIVRSYLSGYYCFAVLSTYIMRKGGIVLFAITTFLECLSLLTVVSAAVEQKRFRLCYCIGRVSPFKSGVNKVYINNFLFRSGILFLIFVVSLLINAIA